MQYFIHDGQKQKGPYSIIELQQFDNKEHLYAWHEGMDDWTPLADVLKECPVQPVFTKPVITKSKKEKSIGLAKKQSGFLQRHPTPIILAVVSTILGIFLIVQQIQHHKKAAQLIAEHQRQIKAIHFFYPLVIRSFTFNDGGGQSGQTAPLCLLRTDPGCSLIIAPLFSVQTDPLGVAV